MSPRRRYPVLLLVLLLVLGAPEAVAGKRWKEGEIRDLLRDRVDVARQSVGIVVGCIDKDRRLVVAYGRTEAGADSPDGDTLFEIGSVTKVFTGILLADMARKGELTLGDPVQDFLPESVHVPTRGTTPIRLYHLSTHTSGLPRMPTNYAPANASNPYADYTVDKLYEFLSGHELKRVPGRESEYSNVAVGLLGHILSLRAGTDYESLVKARITSKLGLDDTTITLSDSQRERLAVGHDRALQPVLNWDIPTLAGAGALRSTVNDLLQFVAANLDFVETDLSAVLLKAREPNATTVIQAGLGWQIRERYGRRIHWHNGRTGGYYSFVGLDKARGRGVVILSNSTTSIDDIGFHLLEPKFELTRPDIPTSATELPDSIAGKRLQEWLEALVASAEVGQQHYEARFDETFKASVPPEQYTKVREKLRGQLKGAVIERVSILGEHELYAFARVDGAWFRIYVKVSAEAPHRISGLFVKPVEAPGAALGEAGKAGGLL